MFFPQFSVQPYPHQGGQGVDSFNARTGVVVPALDDYNAGQVAETADRLFMTAAERTTVSSFRNVLTFPGVQAAVDAGTDATAAIQAAIDACAPLSSPLFFPAGTYRVKALGIKSGTIMFGAFGATVFKLLDNSVNWDFVLKTAGTPSVDNVILRDFCIDGNSAQIGPIGVEQMHGIALQGNHHNWLIDNLIIQNCVGDGIWVTAAASGTLIPEDVRIRNVTTYNCGRQDIAIVNVNGCSVSGCTGDGKFDVEANNSTETCKNIVITDIQYNYIAVSSLGAVSGAVQQDSIIASGLISNTTIHIWGVGYGSFSNMQAAGAVDVSECYRCTFTNIVAACMRVFAANGYFSRDNRFANITLFGSEDPDRLYGLLLSNTHSNEFSGISIRAPGASRDGLKIQNATAPAAANTTTFRDVVIHDHGRYGVYVVSSAAFSNCTFLFAQLSVLVAGTNPINYSSAGTTGYGEIQISGSSVRGRPIFTTAAVVKIDGLVVNGDYSIELSYSAGKKISLDNIKFYRDTVGTPNLSLNNNTDIQSLYVGKVVQLPEGSVTLNMGTSTLASGVKAWIDGPVVESTSWASTLADANIREGSMYRLRGNATNWGYTHNGTAWVAKAH